MPRPPPHVKVGQCYYNTLWAMLGCKYGFAKKSHVAPIEFTGFYLVQGLILIPPDGKYGGKLLGHAWIENEENVYEFPKTLREKPKVTPRPQYYELYSLTEARVRRYTPLEAANASLEHEHCGPWDPAVEEDWGPDC